MNNAYIKLLNAFERFEAESGLPPDPAHKQRFERWLREEFRMDCTPNDETKRSEAAFRRHGWRPIEIDMVQARMSPGERITHVQVRRVITDRQEIARASLRGAKPWTWVNTQTWNSQFPDDEELDDLQECADADARQAEEIRQSMERSARNSEIAAEQMAASRQRQIEAAEDAIAAIVQRSNARRGVAS